MARPSHAIVMCGYGAGSPEWLELEPGVATSTILKSRCPGAVRERFHPVFFSCGSSILACLRMAAISGIQASATIAYSLHLSRSEFKTAFRDAGVHVEPNRAIDSEGSVSDKCYAIPNGVLPSRPRRSSVDNGAD